MTDLTNILEIKYDPQRRETWPLYHSCRALQNWILPCNNKNFRTMGVIVDIRPDYFYGQLRATGVNIRDEINNFIYFHGKIPESFLGKEVDVSQHVIGETKEACFVEQIIMPLDPMVKYEPRKSRGSAFPKEFDCHIGLYAVGNFPKEAGK
jgi:hypothetical protein